MKKLLLLFLLTSFCLSCSQQNEVMQSLEPKTTSITRSPEEAIALALALADAVPNSRTNAPSIENVVTIKSQQSRSDADTLIYAVNFHDNQGFALISAAKTGLNILGYSDTGVYVDDNVNPNSGFSYFMDLAKDYVTTQKSTVTPPLTPIPDPTDPVLNISILAGPHLTVNWGQYFPEGLKCPNKIAGCTQTAMAQMMSFLRSPTSIQLTYPERETQTLELDWNELKKHTKSSYLICNCGVKVETHLSLAILCRELGHRNNAIYNDNATGSNIYNALATFKELCPNISFSHVKKFEHPHTSLLDDLKSRKSIAYIRGETIDGSGHAWVCDGVEKIGTGYYELLYTGEYVWVENAPIYYHFNWGCCGDDNGWFAACVFDNKQPARSRYNFSINNYYFTASK